MFTQLDSDDESQPNHHNADPDPESPEANKHRLSGAAADAEDHRLQFKGATVPRTATATATATTRHSNKSHTQQTMHDTQTKRSSPSNHARHTSV